MAEKAWATPAEVLDVTGTEPTVADIRRAQAAIETITGIVVEDDAQWNRLAPKDRRWLRNAVAYQVAFIAASPDYFERMRVASAAQDGQSATYGADVHELAPLARKAIRKLSWRGRRVIVPGLVAATTDLDALDDALPWRPM